jgi:dephospho-CoA kinase
LADDDGPMNSRLPRGRHRRHEERLPSLHVTTQERRWILGGGLASGKSLVREMLAEAGISTIDADRVGHEVLAPGGPAFGEVAATWPDVVIDGEISRRTLAGIVFDDPEELRTLESITHPHIFDTIRTRMERLGLPLVVEVPLLDPGFGEGWGRIVVDSREATRIARAVERGMSESDARARLAAQPSRAEWLAAADLVIPNHRSKRELREAVETLLPHL